MADQAVPIDPHRGRKVGDKYQVLSQLSAGGMAEIFLAFTAGPGGFRKYVVVKQILPDVRTDDTFIKMFFDEARITAQFSHPNIGQVFDLGEDHEGPYLAMEFIAGQNLNQISKAVYRRGTSLPVGFSCAVARDTCIALQYAHTFMDPLGQAYPVIHRDIAQKNVMVTYTGTTKLLDFGIAQARGKLNRTSVGHVKGTTGYMSPEQTRGDPLDARSDIFSVGVMLHELVTGQRLFAGETEEDEMKKILAQPIPHPSSIKKDLPQALDRVIMKALARERADRFNSAKELARAIEAATGKLLFDADQCATFMKELFEGKMAATRALLETAVTADISQIHTAVKELREDEGLQFTSEPPKTNPTPGAPVTLAMPAASNERDTKTLEATDESIAEELAQSAAVDAAAETPERRNLAGWVIGLVVFMGLGLYFVTRLSDTLDDKAPGKPTEEIKRDLNPLGLKNFDQPPVELNGNPQLPPGKPQEQQEAKQQGSAQDANKSKDKAVAQQQQLKGSSGSLTLITLPEAEVFRGKVALGKTPLFRATLPVGTHLLRLKGTDGVARSLSVKIESGKTTAMKFSLADLPSAQ